MNTLQEGKKSMTETYNEVTALFHGHPDLLRELIQFFPNTSGAASQKLKLLFIGDRI
ncbi:hypothetical protein GLYMA_08G293050v4 [Glycine max]|nr:hypothetical protein GLYMA_08G293050v4 [Glycine max]KAH1053690.1 hypothetical protein GYH30_022787 [Glycine max]